jgi:hypothetical protein
LDNSEQVWKKETNRSPPTLELEGPTLKYVFVSIVNLRREDTKSACCDNLKLKATQVLSNPSFKNISNQAFQTFFNRKLIMPPTSNRKKASGLRRLNFQEPILLFLNLQLQRHRCGRLERFKKCRRDVFLFSKCSRLLLAL